MPRYLEPTRRVRLHPPPILNLHLKHLKLRVILYVADANGIAVLKLDEKSASCR